MSGLSRWEHGTVDARQLQFEMAAQVLRSLAFDTLILGRQLPDLNAEEVMDLVRRRFPGVQVRIVGSPGREELPDHGPLVETDIALQPAPPVKNPLASEVDALPGMVGQGRAMQRVYKLARLVAARNTTTLITGETGTGKELVARAIHEISQ